VVPLATFKVRGPYKLSRLTLPVAPPAPTQARRPSSSDAPFGGLVVPVPPWALYAVAVTACLAVALARAALLFVGPGALPLPSL
jgi:hypothetical protein